MTNSFILAFVIKGIVSSSGYVMPLDQCLERAKEMPVEYSKPVCINTTAPTCKVYLKDSRLTTEQSKRCVERVEKMKGDTHD